MWIGLISFASNVFPIKEKGKKSQLFADNEGVRYCGYLKYVYIQRLYNLLNVYNEKCKGFRRVSSKYFANYTPYDTSHFNKGTVIHSGVRTNFLF